MIDFSTDVADDRVKIIICREKLEQLKAYNHMCLYDVERYRYNEIMLDFESIAAVDYTDILQKDGLKRILEKLTENKQQYDEFELNYLVLRNLLNYSWKLDAMFCMHLKECAQAALKWEFMLQGIACEKKLLEGQQYWLRNEQTALLHFMEPEIHEIVSKVELIMVKSNKVFPKFCSLGENCFILVDRGIYPFLFEWIKIILSGYRIREFNEKSEILQITEPIKTGAKLMQVIVDIILGNKSAFELPQPIMNFSPKDYEIAKEVVMNQIDFLLGHEYGHIYVLKKEINIEPTEEEVFVDEFAINLMNRMHSHIGLLGGDVNAVEEGVNNDIQSSSSINRKIEDIELLFCFMICISMHLS